MYISTMQVAPIQTAEKNVEHRKSLICVCKVLMPVLRILRILGFFPISWTHINNKCVFKKSFFWLIYTFILACTYIYQLAVSVDFVNIMNEKSLLLLLNNITDAIYGLYVIILTVTNLVRYTKWIKTLNGLSFILRDGLFCHNARKTVMLAQYVFIGTFAFTIIVTTGTLFCLEMSQNYHTNFNFNIYINRFLQNMPFAFYVLFFTSISLLLGILACFEKLVISCLHYVPVHPMKGIDDTNNQRDFFGIIYYKLCKSDHHCPTELLKISSPELVEHLRILHEDISLCSYEFNDAMNPQFLFHTVFELIVLIIHWYAVVAYMVYNFKSPYAKTIHILNCLFVVSHTIGLFLFLKNAQQLKNMIQGLTKFLLEYSTRITTQEEHQQVRLFIEKLKQHRPFTASGVFTIDLGIAGPIYCGRIRMRRRNRQGYTEAYIVKLHTISANILTYVLVALQFEIPQE